MKKNIDKHRKLTEVNPTLDSNGKQNGMFPLTALVASRQ